MCSACHAGFLGPWPAPTEGPLPARPQGMNPLEQESQTAVMCQAAVGPGLHLTRTRSSLQLIKSYHYT